MKRADIKQKQGHLSKWIIVAGFFVAVAVCVSVLCAFSAANHDVQAAPSQNLVRGLERKSGLIRTVGQDEFQFYQNISERDDTTRINSTNIENDQQSERNIQNTKDFINRVNAEFYIANQLGLCEPYSFKSFQRGMEKENNLRKIKKERGEVFYGPEQFNLTSYYTYVSSNLKLKTADKIIQSADSKMVDEAKQYFAKNKAKYDSISNIRYELSENGTVTTKELKQSDFITLKTTDGELFDFLYRGKNGEEKEYSLNDRMRKVKILSKSMDQSTFENSESTVMRDYVTLVYYDWLVDTVAKNNPVQFG